jgi:uncharacterized protein (TIGR02145 family)
LNCSERTYATILVAGKIWLAENLAWLPAVTYPGDTSTTLSRYYVYNNHSSVLNDATSNANYQTYGTLYNWRAAAGACPTGWNLASESDWNLLIASLNDESNAGTKLKRATGWSTNSGAITGTDAIGFSALPGGRNNRNFDNLNFRAHFWSDDGGTGGPMLAYRTLYYNQPHAPQMTEYRYHGYSVRCVMD